MQPAKRQRGKRLIWPCPFRATVFEVSFTPPTLLARDPMPDGKSNAGRLQSGKPRTLLSCCMMVILWVDKLLHQLGWMRSKLCVADDLFLLFPFFLFLFLVDLHPEILCLVLLWGSQRSLGLGRLRRTPAAGARGAAGAEARFAPRASKSWAPKKRDPVHFADHVNDQRLFFVLILSLF